MESQNRQLLELDEAKDDFLRGVSHNLQTPLTSIRAYAEQLSEELAPPDRRLGIIAEQSERLSRMVRQLLTVTRLESGALKPRTEVVSLSTRARKAWEALGVDDVPFALEDGAEGWLAVADADQLDQVLWALLDNAVKYGGGTPVGARIVADEADSKVRLTIEDGGPGIAEGDRDRLFARFARGRGGGIGRRERPGPLRLARAVPGDGRGLDPGACRGLGTGRSRGWGPGRGVHDRAARRARRRGLTDAKPPGLGRPGGSPQRWVGVRSFGQAGSASPSGAGSGLGRRARGPGVPDHPARVADDQAGRGGTDDRTQQGADTEELGDQGPGIPAGVEPQERGNDALGHVWIVLPRPTGAN